MDLEKHSEQGKACFGLYTPMKEYCIKRAKLLDSGQIPVFPAKIPLFVFPALNHYTQETISPSNDEAVMRGQQQNNPFSSNIGTLLEKGIPK